MTLSVYSTEYSAVESSLGGDRPCPICLKELSEKSDYEQGQSLEPQGSLLYHEALGVSEDSKKHLFHKACLSTWLLNHNDCPSCRATLNFSGEQKKSFFVHQTELLYKEWKEEIILPFIESPLNRCKASLLKVTQLGQRLYRRALALI